MGNWYADTLCKIHFDMHTPETVPHVGRDFDPPRFARTIRETGAEAVCFFARCAYGWSYYPTQVAWPHPHLSRDLFGEGVSALKAEELRVLAYVAISSLPLVHADAHPEWVIQDQDGTPGVRHGALAVGVCPSRYITEHLIPQFCELAERYPIDGFFLDGVYQYFNVPCYCDRCRREYGAPLPKDEDDPAWHRWRRWQTDRVWRLVNEAARAVHDIRDGVLMGINWIGDVRWSVPPPADMDYLTGDPPMHNCTFETTYHLAAWAWRDKPADLMTERMLTNWQDFTCRTPESIEADYAAGVAGGGKLFIGDLLGPVKVAPDPEVASLLRTTFDFARTRHDAAGGGVPQSDIALLSSPEAVRERGRTWTVDESALRGTYLALIEDGLAADVLFDDDLADHLDRYKTLVLPEQAYIGARAAQVIDRFVRCGNALVVIGAVPAAIDPMAPSDIADRSILEALLGVTFEGWHDQEPGYLCLRGTRAEAWWRDGDPFRPPIPVPGRPCRVRRTMAALWAPLVLPGPAYQLGARPPGEASNAPALTMNRAGTGTVLYCALALASDYWLRGNPGAKYVLQKMIRHATPDLSYERVGPACVHIRRTQAPKQTVLHLAAFQPGHRFAGPKSVDNPAPVPGVVVRVRDERNPRAARLAPEGQLLPVRRCGAWIEIDIPPFTLYSAVVLRWE